MTSKQIIEEINTTYNQFVQRMDVLMANLEAAVESEAGSTKPSEPVKAKMAVVSQSTHVSTTAIPSCFKDPNGDPIDTSVWRKVVSGNLPEKVDPAILYIMSTAGVALNKLSIIALCEAMGSSAKQATINARLSTLKTEGLLANPVRGYYKSTASGNKANTKNVTGPYDPLEGTIVKAVNATGRKGLSFKEFGEKFSNYEADRLKSVVRTLVSVKKKIKIVSDRYKAA